MRRSTLATVALATALVACGGEESPGIPSRTPRTSGNETPAAGENGTGTQATAAACAGVADAKQIATEGDAADLRITDGAVFYRAGTKIIRAAKDGSGKVPVYESPALVRSFVGSGFVFTIEDPTPPNAVIHVMSMQNDAVDPEKPALATEIPTAWNAGGSYFIGVEGQSFYAVGDEQQGEVIYKFSATLPVLQPLATVTDMISSAQIAAGSLWYVRDRSRVFSIPLETLDPNDPEQKAGGEPKEVFGSTAAQCALAVGPDATFCSAGAFVERRTLLGANPTTLLEANKSKVAAPFGSATWFDGTLYLRSSGPDAAMGHAVRALKASGTTVEERVVACGRTAIGEVAVDADSVYWTEPGKGVFMAPR